VRPYVRLADKLGVLIANYIHGAINKIEIQIAGDIAENEVNILTRSVQKGILSQHLGSIGVVNDVNAPLLAKNRGIDVVESRTSKSSGFTNLMTVRVKTNREEKQISGTVLNGYGERIVNLNGYTVDLIPEGNLIIMDHTDQPGIIGKMGSVLGNANVNIATMQVGRNELGGKAIAFLGVDQIVDKETLEELRQVKGIQNIYQVKL